MNLPYFYEQNIQQPIFILSEETSKHCVQVLRMKNGAQLQLTDGNGNLFSATIINADKKNCEVQIEAVRYEQRSASNISIAISLLKNPTRFEWFIEKATEIGITEIIPLICEHTEKENFRFERMNHILVSAMLQSKQSWLPKLHQPKKFNAFIKEDFDGLRLIAHCVETEKKSLLELATQNKNKLMLIGPEGDFSNAEIELALQQKYIPVTLGTTRLRAETAGIVAASLLCNLNIDDVFAYKKI
ncbi:MAG: 16S rRNA (uracil(1498)-N(3))-methyltransferase [Parafilimonas sp.]